MQDERDIQVTETCSEDGLRGGATRTARLQPSLQPELTPHQLFACLALKEFLKSDYRDIVHVLADCPSPRAAIELEGVPHFTTVQKAADRLLKKTHANRLLDQALVAAAKAKILRKRLKLTAIDGSGFETHHASRYLVVPEKAVLTRRLIR